MKTKMTLLFTALTLLSFTIFGQSDDEKMLKNIYDEVLSNGECYQKLDYLSNQIGGRLSGSPQAAAAVNWSKQVMESYGFDTVFLQEVIVPHWVRGKKEIARILNAKKLGNKEMDICALGNSVGTGAKGVLGKVIEVQDFKELEALGEAKVKGKIIFFNRPMDATKFQTFSAYSGAVDQRVWGASEAAKLGATAVIVRSMGLYQDDIPHTGVLVYKPDVSKIPAVAISINGANLLSKALKDDAMLDFYIETHCQTLKEELSYNVIGEITGSEKSNEYIITSGHLDSWDLGDGAHDDGAGCVQAIEALRVFKALNIRPKRSIRAVMYMNEENGLRGGKEYARQTKLKNEKHIAALESDSGGFSPRFLSLDMTEKQAKKVKKWLPLFSNYGVYKILDGHAGADISPLKSDENKENKENTALIGVFTNSQRYFKLHHTTLDTFDKVNKRELELGAATMASMLFLIDKYGL